MRLIVIFIICQSVAFSYRWTIVDSLGTQLRSGAMIDSNTIVVSVDDGSSGIDYTGWKGYLALSRDYGSSWEVIWKDSLDFPDKIHLTSPKHLVAFEDGRILGVIDNSIILRTSNFGKDWDSLHFHESYQIYKMMKYKDIVICYFKAHKFFYYSLDRGDTFHKYELPFREEYIAADFTLTDSNTCYINYVHSETVVDNYLLKSIDGGLTYDTLASQKEYTTNLYFINDSTGFIAGRYNLITDWRYLLFKTTNAGESWTEVYRETSLNHYGSPFNRFAHTSDGLIYAMNDFQTYISEDFGTTWRYLELEEYPVQKGVRNIGIDLYDRKHGIYVLVSKEYVNLLKKTETSVNEIISESNFLISPNPASDYIEISLGSHSVNKGLQPLVHGGEIAIYDVLGNVVWKSTENTLTPALSLREREHRIDISHLPRGVYFVRVGERVEKFVKY